MIPSLLALLLTTAPATQTIETPRFALVHTERAAGAARVLAEQVEPLRDDLALLLGRDWPGVTEVRLGFGREEYEALALPGGAPPSWAVALAYPGHNVVLVEAHSLIQGDGQVTLRHELVHAALGQLGEDWPHWFQEGLAMELTQERRYRVTQYEALSRAVAQGRISRFDDLRARFPTAVADVEVAYAQSAAFVAFLRERHGRAAFGRLLDRVQAGEPFETAFGVAFRSPLSVEEKAFHEQLPGRYPWWPLLLSNDSLVWGVAGVLLVAGWVRRRGQVSRLRAEQARVERLEDVGETLLEARTRPANEDLESFTWGEPGSPELPWVLHSIRVVQPEPATAARRVTSASE